MANRSTTTALCISNLLVHAMIGVHACEQTIRQPLWLTVSFSVDADRAAVQDALPDTIDYAAVCQHVQSFADQTPCRLLESFVVRLADFLQAQFLSIQDLDITVVKKPKDLPYVDGVSVRYRRACQ